jgi:hypothetical protein
MKLEKKELNECIILLYINIQPKKMEYKWSGEMASTRTMGNALTKIMLTCDFQKHVHILVTNFWSNISVMIAHKWMQICIVKYISSIGVQFHAFLYFWNRFLGGGSSVFQRSCSFKMLRKMDTLPSLYEEDRLVRTSILSWLVSMDPVLLISCHSLYWNQNVLFKMIILTR